MSKLKVKVVLDSVSALRELADKDVNISTGFKLLKVINTLNDVITIFDEKRKGLFDKFGDSEGEEVTIKAEHTDEFNSEYEKLMVEEIDIEFDEINVKEFGDIQVKTVTLMRLEWLITT